MKKENKKDNKKDNKKENKKDNEKGNKKDLSPKGQKSPFKKRPQKEIAIILIIIILIFLFQKTYNNILNRKNFENSTISFAEKNKETIFTINKIVFFSSSDSKNKSSSTSNFTIENLYAYTDIALFIDNHINNQSEENNTENTLKSVKVTNIKLKKEPTVGSPNLYYKSIENFAKSEFQEDNKIDKELEFEVTAENEADLSKPVLYNNCANPITISYINQNVKTDYTMTDTENPITYNGKLLKRCGVSIASIETSLSFDVELENNKNQKFRTTVYFSIPYENEGKSIYDGNLTLKKDTEFNFYRYE